MGKDKAEPRVWSAVKGTATGVIALGTGKAALESFLDYLAPNPTTNFALGGAILLGAVTLGLGYLTFKSFCKAFARNKNEQEVSGRIKEPVLGK